MSTFKYIPIWLTLIICTAATAQTALITDIVDPAQQNEDLLYESSSKFVGTRFLFDDFQVGTIHLLNGASYENILIRYNSFDDLIHFKQLSSEKENIVKSSLIKGFNFYVPSSQTLFEFLKIKESFYQEVAKNQKFSILKKHGKRLAKGASPNGYNSGGNDTLDRLIDTESYFQWDSEKLILTEFSTKKADLYEFVVAKGLFSDAKAAKKYAQSNSIDLKTDSGLKELLEKSSTVAK